ncbi:hypothetical protein THARTR1_00348 [Trichoderma harzianum]|uniref:Nuclear condensin complex subunit Smc4 n=1 Tax=Trichoderma harzianum TaxID=5544 RepID=A0A2K0URC3_TRIHA|nr:hypothetical protein THARTR1_00348 [Trichoderma harzianum]
MLLSAVLFILPGVFALPAAQNAVSCSHDSLYTSLSRDGGEFCSSMMRTPCEVSSTPTQFTTYSSAKLSSYCACLMTTCTSFGTAAPSATVSGNGQVNGTLSYTSWRYSRGPTITHGATQARSSDGADGGGSETNSDDGSGATDGTQTSTSSDGSFTGRASIEPSSILESPTDPMTSGYETASGTASGIVGSDTGSMTDKGTRTIQGSSQETATSRRSDQSDNNSGGGSATGTGASGTDGGSAASSQTASTTATGDVTSTRDGGSGGTGATGTAGGGGGDHASTASASDPTSNGGSATQSASNGSGDPGQASSGLNTSSDISYSGSTPTITSGDASTATGWNTSATSSPWGSGTMGSLSSTATASPDNSGTGSVTTNATVTTSLTSAPFITPSGFNSSTISHIVNATQTGPPPLPAANFTQVTRTGAIVKPTCYQMPEPEGGSTRRALLHNTKLREENATIPFPYIESVDFQTDGVDPLYLTLRDAAEGTHYIDVSNRSYIAIVDSLYNAMIIDAKGIHFSTKKCQYDVSITIDSMYQQLAALSGQVCSVGDRKRKRMSDTDFKQTLYLRDQCNNPVKQTVRQYPNLKIGDTDCNDMEVDEDTGRWLFDCTFPGSDSGTMRCEWAVRNDIEEFLFTDPFGGACPDLSTVITTLEANGQDFINPESLRTELYNQGLDDAQKAEANLIVIYYEQLWEILKQAFSKLRTQPPGKASAIQEYIDVYNKYRNFEDDICEDLHAGDMPLKMSLRAGVTSIDAIARLNWAPENPKPFNVTVQDPAKLACCSPGSDANKNETAGTCAYPVSAHLGDTGCVCGNTASGASVAFEITECENFVSDCEVDDDCSKAGHPTYVCLTGSCCGGGVCIDPYECAQNGSVLVRPGLF